jgi:hypothetical protein
LAARTMCGIDGVIPFLSILEEEVGGDNPGRYPG